MLIYLLATFRCLQWMNLLVPQACAVLRFPWHGDHSLLLGLISMYYIIFFFWIHLFNAMSRFRAWSLKLPTIACSAPGFISSCSEQEFLRLREDSNAGSGEQGRNQWGLETHCLCETSLLFDVIHSII